MSTTIDVYPTTGSFPLVEQTRARTQQLFQQLLDRHEIWSIVEVKAFHAAGRESEARDVALDTRWEPGLSVGFAYWINREWDSSSWPSCSSREADDDVDEDSADDYPPGWLGKWHVVAELADRVAADTLDLVNQQWHYWSEHRNAGGPAVASTGYGLVSAAVAEATGGIIASFDSAFDADLHNGETAAEFLQWWGDHQLSFYGPDAFRRARRSSGESGEESRPTVDDRLERQLWLVSRWRGRTERQHEVPMAGLVESLADLAVLYVEAGRHEEAVVAAREAVARGRVLAHDPSLRRALLLARCLDAESAALAAAGQYVVAELSSREAVSIVKAMTLRGVSDSRWEVVEAMSQLARQLQSLTNRQLALGDHRAALASIDECILLSRAGRADEVVLAHALGVRSQVLVALGLLEEAGITVAQAVSRAERWSWDSGDFDTSRVAANVFRDAAQHALHVGDDHGAVEFARRSVDAARPCAIASPLGVWVLVESLMALMQTLAEADPAQALAVGDEVESLLASLGLDRSDRKRIQVAEERAWAFETAGRVHEALSGWEDVVRRCEERPGESDEAGIDLGRTRYNQGAFLMRLERWDEAAQALTGSVDAFAGLSASTREAQASRRAEALHARGTCYAAMAAWDAAADDLRQAIGLLLESPPVGVGQDRLNVMLGALREAMRSAGRGHLELEEIVASLEAHETSPGGGWWHVALDADGKTMARMGEKYLEAYFAGRSEQFWASLGGHRRSHPVPTSGRQMNGEIRQPSVE